MRPLWTISVHLFPGVGWRRFLSLSCPPVLERTVERWLERTLCWCWRCTDRAVLDATPVGQDSLAFNYRRATGPLSLVVSTCSCPPGGRVLPATAPVSPAPTCWCVVVALCASFAYQLQFASDRWLVYLPPKCTTYNLA